jgi:hypothetical protein
MTEEKPESESKTSPRLNLSSKFWKIFLVVVAAFLTFAGPTYVVYVLVNVLDLDYLLSMLSGLALFIAGLVLVWYLIRNKVLS